METKICEFEPTKTLFIYRNGQLDVVLEYIPEWEDKKICINLSTQEAREVVESIKKLLREELDEL